MERLIPKAFQTLQSRTVPLGNQCARRENHAVVQVLDAEFEMQAVVNTCRQLVDALLVDAINGIERQVIADMLQLVGRLDFFLALEHAHIFAVVQNADDLLVLRLHNADVLQHFVHLSIVQTDTSCFRLQH